MDSTNPYGQSQNFMDLLNSQQDSHHPYDIASQTRPLQSSEIPLFSSQCSDEPTLEGLGTAEEHKERKRWSPTDDIVLISAWLNTSKDAVVSNEQKSGAFWTRIATLYNASPKVPSAEKRDHSKCKQRWRKINELVSKFCGAFEAAKKLKTSGQNDDDVLKQAHQIFYNDNKAKFTLEHAWKELRYDQKWCSNSFGQGAGGWSSKRRKREDGSAQSGSSQSVNIEDDEVMVRPPGVKAAKAKRAAKASKDEQNQCLSEIQTMWDLKEKDLAIKDKISDKRVLERLLGKTEPLSDIEIALKNKLIKDMLS